MSSTIVCDVGRVNGATTVAVFGDVTLYAFFIVAVARLLHFGVSGRAMGLVIALVTPVVVLFGVIAMGVLGGSCIEIVTESGPVTTLSINSDVLLRASYAFLASLRQMLLGTTMAILALIGVCVGKSMFEEDVTIATYHPQHQVSQPPAYPAQPVQPAQPQQQPYAMPYQQQPSPYQQQPSPAQTPPPPAQTPAQTPPPPAQTPPPPAQTPPPPAQTPPPQSPLQQQPTQDADLGLPV